MVGLGMCFVMALLCVAAWLLAMCWFNGLGGFGVEPGFGLASLRLTYFFNFPFEGWLGFAGGCLGHVFSYGFAVCGSLVGVGV